MILEAGKTYVAHYLSKKYVISIIKAPLWSHDDYETVVTYSEDTTHVPLGKLRIGQHSKLVTGANFRESNDQHGFFNADLKDIINLALDTKDKLWFLQLTTWQKGYENVVDKRKKQGV